MVTRERFNSIAAHNFQSFRNKLIEHLRMFHVEVIESVWEN